MRHYEYLLFDLDGTLTESGPGIINCIVYALNKHGITETDREKLAAFVGPPLADTFENYYGITGEENFQMILDFRERFNAVGWKENSVYPGIPEALRILCAQGRELVVATSKPEDAAKRIVGYFGLAPYFSFVAGATNDDKRSKKTDIIRYALGLLPGTDLSRVLMVGDRAHDVKGAAENGISCVGVLYGYGDRQELAEAGAAALCPSPKDLPGVIASLEE